ncbi:MAG: 30S ribosomal protein S3 [Chlamydiota bacterium]
MGQKGSPTGFRLIIRKNWKSFWFANKKEFGQFLLEDRIIRNFLMKKPCAVGTAEIIIKRMGDKIEVTFHTARPGLVIGKKGAEIDSIKQELKKLTGKEIWVEVAEIKRPDLNAKLVGEGIAKQIERRLPFRRVLKKAIQATMDAGGVGVKVQIAGRIGGAEIARTEWYKEGRTPLHTLRAEIDYATARAETTYGSIGVKVWVNQGERKPS